MLGAYVLFLLGTLAFNAISVSLGGSGIGKPLFDVAGLMGQFGGNGGGSVKAVLLLAYAGIVLPLVWRDRRAWLALLLPLLAVLWAVFAAIHAIGSVGGQFGQEVSDFVSIDFGFYLSLIAALTLAWSGVKHWLSAT